MVTINNNEVGNCLLNFREGKELSQHVLLVDFQSVCPWKWGAEDFSLMREAPISSFPTGGEGTIISYHIYLKALKQRG